MRRLAPQRCLSEEGRSRTYTTVQICRCKGARIISPRSVSRRRSTVGRTGTESSWTSAGLRNRSTTPSSKPSTARYAVSAYRYIGFSDSRICSARSRRGDPCEFGEQHGDELPCSTQPLQRRSARSVFLTNDDLIHDGPPGVLEVQAVRVVGGRPGFLPPIARRLPLRRGHRTTFRQ